MVKKKTDKQRASMHDIHSSFVENVKSLESFVANLSPVAKKHDLAIVKQTKDRLSTMMERVTKMIEQVTKEVGLPTDDKEKSPQPLKHLNPSQKRQFAEIMNEYIRGLPKFSPHQGQLLYQASFVLSMSYLDFLFADLLRYFYYKYPGSLSEKEHTLTLGELKDFNEIADAIDFLIDKEVQRVLFTFTFDKQVQHFKNFLKVEIKDKNVAWKKLQEAMERRHLIVHNNCIVSKRYLSNVDLSIVPEKRNQLKEGVKLGVREDYFKAVLEEVLIAGVVLIQCCWRKWEQDTIEKADWSLNSYIYSALAKESWLTAERLGLFSKECTVASQEARLYLNVNYCQCLKWQGKNADLEKELNSFDTSTLSPMYRLAVAALKSDSDGFWQNIENAVIVDKMEEADFMGWPLFRELRNDPAYEAKIKQVFASVPAKEREADQ